MPPPDLRPEDIPSTPVSLRRIGRLFNPYRACAWACCSA